MKKMICIFSWCCIVFFLCFFHIEKVNAETILTCDYEFQDFSTNANYKAYVTLNAPLTSGINVTIVAKGLTQEENVENAISVMDMMAETRVCPKYALFLERKNTDYEILLFYDKDEAIRRFNQLETNDGQFLLIDTLYRISNQLIDTHKKLEKIYQEYLDMGCDFSFKIDTQECIDKKDEIKKAIDEANIKVNQAIDAGLPADHYSILIIKEFELKFENMRSPEEPNENEGKNGEGSNNNGAKTNINTFCNDPGVQGTLYILAVLVFIVKILLPVLLIVLGSIDFGKAIISGKEDALQSSAKTFAMRAVAGIIIFLLPTLLNAVFDLVNEYSKNKNSFIKCTNCLLNPSTCDKSKFGK